MEANRKWETVSHISTLISTIAAIVAISLGVYQFKVGIERTDQQIAYIDEEKRPNLVIIVDSVTNGYAACDDCWGYDLIFKNIGTRSAAKIKVIDVLVSVSNIGEDKDFSRYESSSYTSEYANSVASDGNLKHGHLVMDRKYNYHYLRSDIFYQDVISKRQYHERYYYSISLDPNISQWVVQDKFEGVKKQMADTIDQMIIKKSPSLN